jgi:hypothetical protein
MQAGPFRLARRLGEGAFCEVWEGVHPASGERVAVKLLKPEHRARWRGAMRREAHAIARVEHTGVVWIHDAGEDAAAGPWLAIELASGGTLLDRTPSCWSASRAVLADVLAALAHLHARGILHRDLKPANVLICTLDDPRPGTRLADFAIATVGADRGPRGGTPDYAAPEQLRGDLADEGPWTDLFAVGGLAWWLVCGEPPGRAPFEPRFPVPAALEEWLGGLLAVEPWNRPRTAAAALAALQALGAVPDDPQPADLRTFDDHRPAGRPHPRRSPASLGLSGLRPVSVIGRVEERRALRAASGAVVAGRGPKVVRLVGASGLGKTHLVTDLVTEVREGGAGEVVWVSGAAGGLDESLRAGLAEAVGLDRRRDLASVSVHVERWRHAPAQRLATWLAGADEDGVGVFLAWARGRPGPVVLVLEDLPGGEASAALVGRLATSAVPNLLVVATTRAAPPHPLVEDLRLAPLADPVRLVRALGIVDPQLADAVGGRSGGVPALVVALVRELVRTGSLVPDGRGYVLAPGASLPTPEALAADTWSRVPVAPHDRAALEVLALLDGEGEPETWAAACWALGLPEVEEQRELWARSGLIRLHPTPRVSDALLAALLVEELALRRATAPVAAVLAEALGALPETPARSERLAVMSFLAGAWERSVPLLFRAATHPRHIDDPERSHALLDRMLEALEHVPPSPWRDDRTSEAHLGRSMVRGNHGQAEEALRNLLEHPPSGDHMQWRHPMMVAEMAMRIGRPWSAERTARLALAKAPEDRRVLIRMVLGRALIEQGDPVGALSELPDTGSDWLAIERANARLLLGDPDAAEVEVARVTEPTFRHAGTIEMVHCAIALRRGQPAFARLTALMEGPWTPCDTHLNASVAVARLHAGVREGVDGLVALEARARSALHAAGTRSILQRVVLEDAAAHAPPELAERLWDLAESQTALESG